MKEFFLPVFVVTVLLVAVSFFSYNYVIPMTEEYLKNQIPGVVIRDVGIDVVVADTEKTRERGLSGLASIPSRAGLLMVFDTSDYYGIWMKDMQFPIDVIWIDDTLHVVDTSEVLKPEDFPEVYEPSRPARMALEVNAQFVATYKIEIGDEVRLAEHLVPEDLKKE